MRSMIITLGMMALAACGTSPPTRFFMLDPVGVDVQSRPQISAPIEVDAVHIPPALDRQSMVRGESDHELKISSQERWGADFGEMARRVLTQDLQDRLAPGMVIPPHFPAPANARGVVVNILSFDPAASGRLVLDADWTLLEGSPAKPMLLRTARLSAPVGESAASQAAAMSRLLGQLADEIVSGISQVDSVRAR